MAESVLVAAAVPAPLEHYARLFDALFQTKIQRQRFREYVAGLLLPRDRNKTLTALVGAEPITQAQTAPVQQLQFFLSEADWDAEAVNRQRIKQLQADEQTRAHAQGVLIIDETGDRKDGHKTAHVAHQYLGSIGKIANGIVVVTSVWADERVYYPLHVRPYTPASRLAKGKHDPAFHTKPQLARELVTAARTATLPFRAVVADSLYGENAELETALWNAQVPYVLGLKPSHGVWAPEAEAHSPREAAARLQWQDAEHPGDWTAVVRRFRDGHDETWWAADLRMVGYGPDQPTRLVAATTDPARLPTRSTWYLVTTLPLPAAPGGAPPLSATGAVPHETADLAEIVRLYGLRQWVEQSYKQVKQELGWADFQVRADRAIRRHWYLVCCAFAFCWWAEFHPDGAGAAPAEPFATAAHPDQANPPPPPAAERGVGEKGRARAQLADRVAPARGSAFLAAGPASRPELARSLAVPAALLARVVACAPTPATACPADRRH